ncbi:MAG TPA: MBL fold metallo-hydrolase [Chitinophaga sp.]|uniref:MBL fold metallo-hydrolase n=1 Tax=Chitinophaga sp. TaxID=1869181 RepID=UPI002BE44D59|nr:MBL fold metallo-hydrolase [Chitinophaga sp.]HVI43513.1 MBL fold metallo-hydrolase [Chitinophaga sp.]
MNRRELIKGATLLGFAGMIPASSIKAQEKKNISRNKQGFRRFQLNELELTIVTDGHILLSPVQPMFAPHADPEQVKQLLRDSFRPTDGIDLGINVLVIRKKDKVILLDAGAGATAGEQAGWLPETLKDAGIQPSQVTDFVISHAHADHIGGLVDKNGKLLFPNATVHLAKPEQAFWLSAHPDFSKSGLGDEKVVARITGKIKELLVQIKDRIRLYNPGDTLLDCIRLQLAEGHTPGHTIATVFSGKEEVVYVADLVHSDVLLLPHPEWGFFGDTNLGQAAATRRSVLEQLAQERKRVLVYHFPWPGIGHVRKKETGFEWVPDVFPTPNS